MKLTLSIALLSALIAHSNPYDKISPSEMDKAMDRLAERERQQAEVDKERRQSLRSGKGGYPITAAVLFFGMLGFCWITRNKS